MPIVLTIYINYCIIEYEYKNSWHINLYKAIFQYSLILYYIEEYYIIHIYIKYTIIYQ